MSETASHPLTPEDYRRRYFELKARAQDNNFDHTPATLAPNPKTLARDAIVLEETIPAGWYWAQRIPAGQSLRIINDEATAGVSALIWNARDSSERLNPADTVKVQWTARISRGRLLLSDMGRVLASITDDTCGLHDFVAGASSRPSDERKFGVDPDRRNSRDNFILAATKHGLSVRDVGPCATFFAPVVTDEGGRFTWASDAVKPGDYLDLRAEMDLIIAISNCPHPLSPGRTWRAAPVRVIVWRSQAPATNDYCRTATEEQIRAFDNTDATLRA